MRLISADNLLLRDFTGSKLPPYAALSHCRLPDEICYHDMVTGCSRSSRDDTDDGTTTEEEFDSEDSHSDSDSDVGPTPRRSHPGVRRRPNYVDARSHSRSRSRSRPRLATNAQRERLRRVPSAYSEYETDPGVATPMTDARSSRSSLGERPSPPLWKLRGALEAAKNDGLDWVWIDSCCVNIKSKSEVREAIEGAWNIFGNAAAVYIYMHDFELPKNLSDMDLPESDEDSDEDGGAGLGGGRYEDWRKRFYASKWHRRAWTLPEMLAARSLTFFDRNWDNVSAAVPEDIVLHTALSKATLVPVDVIARQTPLDDTLVAARMSWMANRVGGQPEDQAYALAGLFGIHIEVRLGEGAVKAFHRLQQEILKTSTDESILLWDSERTNNNFRTGLLADRPEDFLSTEGILPAPAFLMPNKAVWSMTNRGLQASLSMTPHASPSRIGNFRRVWLNLCKRESRQFMCFFIQQIGDSDEYVRIGSIIPVETDINAFSKERQQQTIVVPQIPAGAEENYAMSPRASFSSSSFRGGLVNSSASSQSRPHVRFHLDGGTRRGVPYTPAHRPSWAMSPSIIECISPIPHADTYVAILQFELKTPSHAAKVEGKFLVVACVKLLRDLGRWICALRIDEAEDYRNEMPNLTLGEQRTRRDSLGSGGTSRTMAQLDVGIEGDREIRAEVCEAIDWHEQAFDIMITCPVPSPTTAPPVGPGGCEKILRGSTPLSLNTGSLGGMPTIPGGPPSAGAHRSRQRFSGPPPAAGFPPPSARMGNRIPRSMSVDHGSSPYMPPLPSVGMPPSSSFNGPIPGPRYGRAGPEVSPPHSTRAGVTVGRKRESWGGPPIGAPPTPLSPPRRPTTVRPGEGRGATRPPLTRPASRFGHQGYSPSSYDTPLSAGSRHRRDSSGGASGYDPLDRDGRGSFSSDRRGHPDNRNHHEDLGMPPRRSTWTPAPGQSGPGLGLGMGFPPDRGYPPAPPSQHMPRDPYAPHGHSSSFSGMPPTSMYDRYDQPSPTTRSFSERMIERDPYGIGPLPAAPMPIRIPIGMSVGTPTTSAGMMVPAGQGGGRRGPYEEWGEREYGGYDHGYRMH